DAANGPGPLGLEVIRLVTESFLDHALPARKVEKRSVSTTLDKLVPGVFAAEREQTHNQRRCLPIRRQRIVTAQAHLRTPDLFGPRKNPAELDVSDPPCDGGLYSGGSGILVTRYTDAAGRGRSPRDEDKRHMARRLEN